MKTPTKDGFKTTSQAQSSIFAIATAEKAVLD